MNSESAQSIPPEQMLGSSDWDDEDLLTVVEASERLVDEIKASRERIRQAEEVLADEPACAEAIAGPGLEAERKRLEDLMLAVERINSAHADAPR